jgi:hypothetical protein
MVFPGALSDNDEIISAVPVLRKLLRQTPFIKKGEITMAMKAEIRDNKIYIEIDLETPTPSASGKTLVVASTRGNAVTAAKVNDKPVIIGLNAYIKP